MCSSASSDWASRVRRGGQGGPGSGVRRAPVCAGRPASHRGRGHGPLRSACVAGCVGACCGAGYPSLGSWRAARGRGEVRHTSHGREEGGVRGHLAARGGEVLAHRGGAVLRVPAARSPWGCAQRRGPHPWSGGGVRPGAEPTPPPPPPMPGRDRGGGAGGGGGPPPLPSACISNILGYMRK